MAKWRGSTADQAVGIARRVRSLWTLAPADAVHVVQKEPVMPPMLYRALGHRLRRSLSPIVWDIDDAIWLGRRGAAEMASHMCHVADHVVAGNRLLAEWAESSGARAVTVVPTCFDPAVALETNQRFDGPRIVWIGSPATAPLLEPFAPHLAAALTAIPTLTMQFVGGLAPRLLRGHERVESTAWSPESEVDALTVADFGLALQDRSEYNDHKCGFKVVQYLAYGVVPIASDGPVHREIIGELGLLVDKEFDSAPLLERLSSSPSRAERTRLIEHHRRRYSTQRAVSSWSGVLGSVGRA